MTSLFDLGWRAACVHQLEQDRERQEGVIVQVRLEQRPGRVQDVQAGDNSGVDEIVHLQQVVPVARAIRQVGGTSP